MGEHHVKERIPDHTKRIRNLHGPQEVGSRASEDPEVIVEEEEEEIFLKNKNSQPIFKVESDVTIPSFTHFQSHVRDNPQTHPSMKGQSQLPKLPDTWVQANVVL